MNKVRKVNMCIAIVKSRYVSQVVRVVNEVWNCVLEMIVDRKLTKQALIVLIANITIYFKKEDCTKSSGQASSPLNSFS